MVVLDTIFYDSDLNDDLRRAQLYHGRLFGFSPRKSTLALCDFARGMIEDAFHGRDPRTAQYSMPVEEFVSICAPLKPRFIHHPETLRLIRDIVEELRCCLDDTYIDVPRLRMVTHGGYLTSGVGYAHHPHRDTWYSAPMSQLNWWLPIYPFDAESGMAFHPRYWHQPVKNGSSQFNYYRWNEDGRKNAAQHIKQDTRVQPHAEEPLEVEPQFRLVCPPGGIILFSAAQMHSTVANTSGFTRYSIDFRTINLGDVVSMHGAPNIDSAPTGTSLRDFRRASDFAPISVDIVRSYEQQEVDNGMLVFRPS
jgi:Phytanoyl-CoA dioxygenase (PhyH)